MKSIGALSNSGSSLRGWMQSTGQTSTQAVSFVSMQGSVMMNGILGFSVARFGQRTRSTADGVTSTEILSKTARLRQSTRRIGGSRAWATGNRVDRIGDLLQGQKHH